MKAATVYCCAFCVYALFTPFKTSAVVQNCSWAAGSGAWEFALNWSCGFIPNNDATNDFNVTIGDIATVDGVTLGSGVGIFHITVESGSKLYFTNGANLFINNIPNAMTGYPEQELAIGGDVVFQNSGSATLSLSKGDMTLRGFTGIGGTVWLTNSFSTIDGITANTNYDTRLIMIEGTTIRGAGQITDLALMVDSQSQILADNGGTLRWQPNTDFFDSTNHGLLQAAGSNSVLVLDQGSSLHTLYNGGGLVSALNGSAVELLASFKIVGGNLQSVGSGRLRGGGELQDLTLNGGSQFDVIARNGWLGSIVNEGVFNVTGNNSVAIDSSLVTLTGGGSVLLTTNAGGANASEIYLFNGSLRNMDNLIHGQGIIQSDISTRVLDNSGRIEADTPGQAFQQNLWLDPSSGLATTWTNSGTLRATNGGFLTIGAAVGSLSLANSNGLIVADSNSTVRLLDSKIYNGTAFANGSNAVVRLAGSELHDLVVSTTNGGLVAVADLGGGVNGAIDRVLNLGNVVVSNGCTLRLSGDVTNEGRIFLDPNTTTTTHLTVPGITVTLSGNGTVELNHGNLDYLDGQGASSRLINAGNTIRGTGGIQSVLLVNQGIVQADAATPLFITAPVYGPWTNHGTLRATGAGGLRINEPLLVNLGTVNISAGSHLGLISGGKVRQDAGELIVDGMISNEFASGSVAISAGTLRGSGVIVGNVTNIGGVLTPGSSPGRLTISGAFTQQASGTLEIEIGGTTPGVAHDQLAVGTSANLAGVLNVNFTNNFAPSMGDTFEILTSSSRTGTFSTGGGFAATNGVVLVPLYGPTNVVLVAATNLPSLLQPVYDGSSFQFSFQTANGIAYQAQYTDSLSPPVDWHDVGGPFLGDGSLVTITNMPLASAQRFYRMRYE